MRRVLAFCLAFVFAPQVLPAWSLPAAAEVVAESPERHRDACRHYENRARFRPRIGRPDTVTLIADACAAALGEAADSAAPFPRREAATVFLDRLAAARAEIGAINRRRVSGEGDQLRVASAARTPLDLSLALGLVNETGERLILQSAGVLRALDAWRGTEPERRTP